MSKNSTLFFDHKSEWSHIKDSLLSYYLKPYVTKIVHTGRPLIYVDGFAGPGMFNDGELGSPLIACQKIKEAVEESRVKDVNVKKVFIEIKHADQLRQNLSAEDALIHKGSFTELLNFLEPLDMHRSNLFLYVDPFGIKHLDMTLFDKLAAVCPSVELLINFNSFGFLREACRVYGIVPKDLSDDDGMLEYDPWDIAATAEASLKLDAIMGGSSWRGIIERYKSDIIDGYEAECDIAKCYASRLNNSFRYVLNFPVRLKAGHRPKYRMLHGSNHPDGAILMYQSMEKGKEHLLYMQGNGQGSLFDQTIENEIICDEDIKNMMLEELNRAGGKSGLNEFYALFMANVGITLPFKELKRILKEMETASIVKIAREPMLTTGGRHTSFMEEKSTNKAWIGAVRK